MDLRSWRQVLQNRCSSNACTSLSFIERALGNIIGVVSHHVSGGFVACNNVSTFHTIFVNVSLADA